jgi:hypothetical protein
MTRARAGCLLGLLAAVALTACALGPVESDPIQAEARAAAMKRDCLSRGGVWDTDKRTCIGADPARRN